MLNLQELIDDLVFDTKLKICVHDISGILMNEKLKIRQENKIHFCDFCNMAKSTQKGYKLCLACKTLANSKAISAKTPFEGFCPWGIFEAVHPVVINGTVRCIVYVGNALPSDSAYNKCSAAATRITGVDSMALSHAKTTCDENTSCEKIIGLSKIVSDFIVLLSEFYMYDKMPVPSAVNRVSNAAKEYADLNFRQPLTLSSLSKMYFINEKYLGRIFKKTWGISFHEYLNELRLNNASKLLRHGNMPITDVAFDSGFENVTYFNRLFRRRFGKTPTQYRESFTQME